MTESTRGLGLRWESALGELIMDLARAKQEAAVFEVLATHVPRMCSADRISVARPTEDGSELEVWVLLSGSDDRPARYRSALDGTAVQTALDDRRVVRWQIDGSDYAEADDLLARGYRECVNIPLIGEGSAGGTLNVLSREPGRFGDDEVSVLVHVAALATATIERHRLLVEAHASLERARRTADRLVLLNDVGEALQKALTDADVLRTVADALPQLVPADHVAILVRDDTGEHAVVSAEIASRPVAAFGVGRAIPLAGSAIGEVFRAQRVRMYPSLDPGLVDHAALAGEGYVSVSALPIVVGGNVAVVVAAASAARQAYSHDTRSLLTTFARLAGASLQRVHEHGYRQRVEADLRQTEKLQSLGMLAGGIAHDFNNLLTGILGNATLAQGDLPEASAAAYAVAQITDAATRAAELTGQLLAYTGKHHLTIARTDIGELVRSACAQVQETTLRPSLSVTVEVPPSPLEAVVDPAYVREIVRQLLLNADEALLDQDGPAVRVTVELPDASSLPTVDALGKQVTLGPTVALSVADNGPGMGAGTLERAFEPFFTTKFTGRGLGLPAVAGLVRSHGGAVTATSSPGEGAVITVYLPLGSAVADQSEIGSDLEGTSGRGVILVVDDNEQLVSLAARVLDREGFDVLAATDGLAALDLVAQHGDSLAGVILDVTMPGMSGDEVYRSLIRLGVTAPVIVSSGYAEDDALSTFRSEPVAGFLQKPYRAGDLAEMVVRVTTGAGARAAPAP